MFVEIQFIFLQSEIKVLFMTGKTASICYFSKLYSYSSLKYPIVLELDYSDPVVEIAQQPYDDSVCFDEATNYICYNECQTWNLLSIHFWKIQVLNYLVFYFLGFKNWNFFHKFLKFSVPNTSANSRILSLRHLESVKRNCYYYYKK